MNQIRILFDDVRAIRLGTVRGPVRTRRLVASPRAKKAKKVGEEGVEVALEATTGDKAAAILESADLLYNLVVLWEELGIDPDEIEQEMARRRSALGVAEKLPKPG